MSHNIHTHNAPALLRYTLRIADNAMINGQRLSEWCGIGPELEQDIALTNVALDQIGQARMLYQYAAEMYGQEQTEDHMAFFRREDCYYNLLILELPNGHWGYTVMKQFLFDTFNYYFFTALCKSKNTRLSEIAQKSIKEITYHAQWSAEWVIRLGDGTEESHQKMQDALNDLWMWTGEMCTSDAVDQELAAEGIAVDLETIKTLWIQKVDEILNLATLKKPQDDWYQSGGKQGKHTEHLGYILAEMQHLPRVYPNAQW